MQQLQSYYIHSLPEHLWKHKLHCIALSTSVSVSSLPSLLGVASSSTHFRTNTSVLQPCVPSPEPSMSPTVTLCLSPTFSEFVSATHLSPSGFLVSTPLATAKTRPSSSTTISITGSASLFPLHLLHCQRWAMATRAYVGGTAFEQHA